MPCAASSDLIRGLIRNVLLAIGLGAIFAARSAAAGYVWLEGEKPDSANIKWNNAGSSHMDWLSGGHWLTVTIDPDQIEKSLPADGGLLSYKFTVSNESKQEVWARIGFEFARSAFDWKLDDGAWSSVTPNDLTVDAMELDFFAEAAWLKLADAALTNGDHQITFRIPRTKDKDGKWNHVLFALDAVCITPDRFFPHSRYKPDEAWRTAKDDEAAQHVFDLPDDAGGGLGRSVALSGLWEICRHDEQQPRVVAEPIRELPDHPFWGAIAVPGDRNELRPDLLFGHRFWYRTRVSVPANLTGRSFYLSFPQNNLNTTVYVNGVYCGFDKNPFAHVQIDVTAGIKPGTINEIWVGMRDAWYGRSADPDDPMKLRRTFNLPTSFFNQGFQDLAYPVWSKPESGILQTPTLTNAGSVYVSDVFVKPSVAKKQLAADITLDNSSPKSASGQIQWEAIDGKTNQVVHRFAARPFTIEAGKIVTIALSDAWADAKLWWPDDPNLYTLRTIVLLDGKAADVTDTSFGFREWSIDGIHFKLNGINFHGWCDQHTQDTPEHWLEFQRKTHQQMMRFWGTTWMGMSPDAALDWFDKNGVVVRRSGVLDGEAIGYHADEPDEKVRKRTGSDIKLDLLQNWRDQVVAQVKGERNHPSVMIWSIENEWIFINCINLYGGLMDAFETEETKTAEAVSAADPTRPLMSDGGAACKKQTLPVCGNHYVTGPMSEYPTLAYDANATGGGRGRWVWDQKRPRLVGEDWFIAGNHPELATIGGEMALTGKTGSLPAAGLMTRILQEGYRWSDFGGWDFWMNNSDADGSQYIGFSPRAIFCRRWNWTFGSGERVLPKFAVFNDTRFDDPIELQWSFRQTPNRVATGGQTLNVQPGTRIEIQSIHLEMPSVTQRTEGELKLSLKVRGEEVFSDTKHISVLPTGIRQPKPAGISKLRQADLLLFDPTGSLGDFLKARQIPFTALNDLSVLPDNGKVLVIGKDALPTKERTSSKFAAWAASGRAVIVLEQKDPLEYQALPAEIAVAANLGRTAFPEDLSHPAMAGLEAKDFFTWGDDEIVYRNAYSKPTRGAKSLIECDDQLKNSALIEIPVDKGLLLLSQLVLEEKLATNATAQQLLLNLIDYGATYQLVFRPTIVAVAHDSALSKTIDAIGLTHTSVDDPLGAIAQPGEKIAVIEATPDNLKKLATAAEKVSAFTEAGGWILLNGLNPEGLDSYNKIVGVEHMIRPFRRERVTFSAVRNPLTAGIPAGDVTMYSSKRIFPWQEGNYVVDDEFSYCVDYDEVAPFANWNNDFYYNLVNGFVSADGWPFIVNVPIPASGPLDMIMTFPKPQTITECTWVGNTLYWPTTKMNFIFDGNKTDMASFSVPPNHDPQTLTISPPRTGSQITVQLAEWTPVPNVQAIIGGDNIYLKAQRSPEFYAKVKPMLNNGGMMEYPRGKGGIVLCNLLFKDHEEVPDNAQKKRSIFSALLRNLKAPFTGGKTVIVGANLSYSPIDISKQANQFRTERGWFGDKNFTFAELPSGHQTFAGVPFDIFDFPTSPVPTAVMLGGPGIPGNLPDTVKGIPVNRKADALFFLQTARIDRRRSDQEVKEGKKFELAQYIIHYTDGRQATVPIDSEIDIDNYRQDDPHPLPGAQIAWTRSYDKGGGVAVAFTQQWNNPRPDVEIQSIDMQSGPDKVGVPVLLAIAAASAK